jgi:hypothetical protein
MLPTPFPTNLDKLALAVHSSVQVKEIQVKEYGIGEDINMNLYAWVGDYLAAICQMTTETMMQSHEERFGKVANATCILRKALGVDGFTMIAEGYVSNDPVKTQGMALADAFVREPDVVNECLTFMHVTHGTVTFITKSYTYDVPRIVKWYDEVYTPGRTLMRGGDGKYPTMLAKVLDEVTREAPPEDVDTYLETLGIGLRRQGFEVTWL